MPGDRRDRDLVARPRARRGRPGGHRSDRRGRDSSASSRSIIASPKNGGRKPRRSACRSRRIPARSTATTRKRPANAATVSRNDPLVPPSPWWRAACRAGEPCPTVGSCDERRVRPSRSSLRPTSCSVTARPCTCGLDDRGRAAVARLPRVVVGAVTLVSLLQRRRRPRRGRAQRRGPRRRAVADRAARLRGHGRRARHLHLRGGRAGGGRLRGGRCLARPRDRHRPARASRPCRVDGGHRHVHRDRPGGQPPDARGVPRIRVPGLRAPV